MFNLFGDVDIKRRLVIGGAVTNCALYALYQARCFGCKESRDILFHAFESRFAVRALPIDS